MRSGRNQRFAAPAFSFLAFAFSTPAFPSEASRVIEYLYVNASEGTASGGHAAIQFGDEVFHFQHVPPGLLRAFREESRWFRHQYSDLENRAIHVHRIAVSEETYRILRDHFSRQLLIQVEQFERRAAIEKDRRLIEFFLGRQDGHLIGLKALELNGAGLFVSDGWKTAPGTHGHSRYPVDPGLSALRALVQERYGPDVLRIKSKEIRMKLQRLHPSDLDLKDTLLSEDRFLPAVYSFADRYADLLTALRALQVLERGMPLGAEVLFRPADAEFRLNPVELATLTDFRRRLATGLVELIGSERPDWGLPLLLGMARLIVLDASIASQRMVVLDVFKKGEAVSETSSDNALRRALFDEVRHQFRTEKQALSGRDALDERRYSRIEQASAAYLEFTDALRQGRPFRLFAGAGKPIRPARVEPIWPGMTAAQMSAYLDKLKAYGEAYDARLAELYGYDLISRNCVSEIFRSVDAALAGQLAKGSDQADREQMELLVQRDSIRRLGGYLDRKSLNFIPFVSFDAVGQVWRVSDTQVLPSFRHQRLHQAYRNGHPWLVGLRESNVLSSSLYHWHGRDAAFLFFTDEAVWSRPFAGGVNTLIGLGQGVAGLLTWPWDSGKNLHQGLKGLLISLPELVFFNIRKGSYPALPVTRIDNVTPTEASFR